MVEQVTGRREDTVSSLLLVACDNDEGILRCCQDVLPANTIGVLQRNVFLLCDVFGALPQNHKKSLETFNSV
jgi:hypothetical protein